MADYSCKIKLMNQFYEVKYPEGEEDNLLLAAKKLDDLAVKQKLKFKNLDDFHALLLAALTVSHELVNAEREQEVQREQVNQFISSIESKINRTVEGAD